MRWVFFAVFFLASCGRPLTDTEKELIASIHGDQLDVTKVRLIDNAPVRSYTLRIPKRPRVTCSEKILPEPKTEIVTGAPAAVALFNRIWLNHDYALPDYAPGYPERLYLLQAMFLAHEMTHVWQWQNRERTGYTPLKAAREHQTAADPYLFDPDETREFLSFGYEQQGAIVEEYICCAALDPEAPRTKRLANMIGAVMPLQNLPKTDVIVPWDGAELEGICR